MAHAIAGPQPFSVYTLLDEGIKSKSTNIFGRVKNVLTGRVFENWRESLLSLATVYYVIKAAVTFFSGHWIMALIEISTAGFMAVLRKEIADFTNLHKATASYREQNMEFALNNLDLRKGLSEFKAEVQNLRQESAHFQRNNQDYEYNNQVHAELLRGLESTTAELGDEIRDALDSGTALTENVLRRYLEKLQRFDDTKGTLRAIQTEMSEERAEALQRFEQLTVQVNEMSINGVRALRDADEQLQGTLREISRAEERARSLGQQITRLEGEINHLEQTRRGLQGDVSRLHDVTGQLEVAASRNVASANMVAGGFKALFYTQDEHGHSSFTTDKMFVPLLIGAFVAKAYFSN